ncbi:VWA domain-containing protein [Acidobacteriota bacterium]
MKKLQWLMVTAVLVGHVSGLGAAPQTPTRNELQHEVSVNVKLIQVFVLDKTDSPVTDLSRDDFIIYYKGRPQVITEFEKHLLPKDIRKEELPVKTQLASARATPLQISRKFFFVFDLDRITLDGYMEAKEAALYFLDTQVQPGDHVGLITYSVLRGMTPYESLTDDFLAVRDKLEKFREVLGRPGGGASLWGMRAEALSDLRSQTGFALTGLTQEIYGAAAGQRNPETDWHEMKNLDFVRQMEEMAKDLRAVPGYKNIILFSNGFPRVLYEQDTFFQKNFDRMAQEFATANSPVHTINTEGGRQYSRSIGSRGDSSLKNLSHSSGGRHFQNVKQHESIAKELQALTGNYYVLGYYAPEVADGKFHKIKIEVKRPGCRVLAQSGYFIPKK